MTTKRAAYGGWAGPESVPKTGSPPKITAADTALKMEKAQQMDLQQQMSATTKAAFVDELLKLSTDEQPEKSNFRRKMTTAAGVAGLGYTAHLLGAELPSVTAPIVRGANRAASDTDFSKLWGVMGKGRQVDLHRPYESFLNAVAGKKELYDRLVGVVGKDVASRPYSSDGHADRIFQAFADGKNYARVPQGASAAIAAHEFGHLTGPRWSSEMNAFGGGALPGLTSPVALGMAAFSKPDSRWSKAAPWVALAGGVPRLIEEGGASARGLLGMYRAGHGAGDLLRGGAQLSAALGSYMAMPAAGALGAYGIRKFKQKRLEQEKAEKTASEGSNPEEGQLLSPVRANAGHYKQLAKNLAVILPATAVGAGLGHLAGTAVRNTDLGQQFLGNRWAGGIGPVVGATALTGGAVVLRHLLDQMGQEKIRAAGEDRARELATRSEG